MIHQLSTEEITFAMAEEKYLFQEEFLDSPDQFQLRENFKRATNGVKYSERDVGKLLASLADDSYSACLPICAQVDVRII